jgi:hypothetical protein
MSEMSIPAPPVKAPASAIQSSAMTLAGLAEQVKTGKTRAIRFSTRKLICMALDRQPGTFWRWRKALEAFHTNPGFNPLTSLCVLNIPSIRCKLRETRDHDKKHRCAA